MHLYKTTKGIILENNNSYYLLDKNWDLLINQTDLFGHLTDLSKESAAITEQEFKELTEQYLLPPVGSQEVWASGVTYLRSRNARMEESKDAGGGDFYERVYDAERPELFFKSTPQRVAGPGQEVYIRKDSTWNVPEPELTLYMNSSGSIQGYTVGNDMSSRSIEGENPLYLPQAKTYERSAALGPCLYVPQEPLPTDTTITLVITRGGKEMFNGSIQVNKIKREFKELAAYLFRETNFDTGCFLMTGTGIVPPDHFTLEPGDEVSISIEGIGTLTNVVAYKS
ncbi:fumarylacetoacetate hydrolase family protein [Foetidibacter luteolus]|uniref:fumarylacetoacetate hydrolase family protein n=1 Tax=Foetidibacter luteolus TaxID=2608880 RepID=UPI00129B558F|nr:fumarylacetoacetate hydrolase family protein [Foetidibacter luteolus]